MLCALWTHYIWPNVMSLNLQTFWPALFLLLLLIFSLFLLMTADPLCSCCHSSPVVRRFVLLSKALDRWAGVHNPRWVFCGYSIGRCSSISLFSRFLFSSSTLGVRLTNTSTWMLKCDLWKIRVQINVKLYTEGRFRKHVKHVIHLVLIHGEGSDAVILDYVMLVGIIFCPF